MELPLAEFWVMALVKRYEEVTTMCASRSSGDRRYSHPASVSLGAGDKNASALGFSADAFKKGRWNGIES